MLELARSGGLDVATEQMSDWVAANPEAPQGHYNLAVFLDAAGHYDDALDTYDDALRAGGPGWYAQTRAGCVRPSESQIPVRSRSRASFSSWPRTRTL